MMLQGGDHTDPIHLEEVGGASGQDSTLSGEGAEAAAAKSALCAHAQAFFNKESQHHRRLFQM